MLYPDPKQRVVLGWQIRWIAGLFSLLMVAAGAVPTFAAEDVDSPRGAEQRALFATADDERVCSVDIMPATSDLLGAKTVSEAESEKAEEADASPAPLGSDFYLDPLVASSAAGFEDRSPRRIDPSGRLAPRAPPIA